MIFLKILNITLNAKCTEIKYEYIRHSAIFTSEQVGDNGVKFLYLGHVRMF